MSTTVEICNIALGKLGAELITSLDDDSDRARYCRAFFDQIRDAALREHPWGFAQRRAELVRLAEAPAFGYAHAFQLPPECLLARRLESTHFPFTVEADTLLTDAEQAQLVYTARVTDPALFDPAFAHALACRLAAELSYRVAASRTLGESMWTLYQQAISRAKLTNAIEGPEALQDYTTSEGSWLGARS